MIDPYTAALCAFVLMVAGILELAANPSRQSLLRYSGFLAAFGFFMLGTRFFYLIETNDLGRMNIFGVGSIAAIALGRIIACAAILKNGRK